MSMPEAEALKRSSPAMFDVISARYDRANAFISLGGHRRWRLCMAGYLPPGAGLRVLDLACGTADVPLALHDAGADLARVTGIDLADAMLAIGRCKVSARGLEGKITLRHADALFLPFDAGCFDVVTVAFGLRNMPDLAWALIEARRVLRPGGRLIVLEFGRPESPLVYPFYRLYLNFILPWLGGILTGSRDAYRYLARTIRSFPCGERFVRILEQTGFSLVARKDFVFGSVCLYCAEKPV